MKEKKFNLLDALIIVLVIVIIGGFVLYKTVLKRDSEKVQYAYITIEITEMPVGFSENIVIGDTVTEKVQNEKIGTVTDFYTTECTKYAYNNEKGVGQFSVVPDMETEYVTVRVQKDADIAVGKMMSIYTKHFAGYGYTVDLRYEEDN